jgi:hypothetical protein
VIDASGGLEVQFDTAVRMGVAAAQQSKAAVYALEQGQVVHGTSRDDPALSLAVHTAAQKL